jgi:hypothetical protein
VLGTPPVSSQPELGDGVAGKLDVVYRRVPWSSVFPFDNSPVAFACDVLSLVYCRSNSIDRNPASQSG